ncbi:hypothetical protein CkaCkLH20_06201 [Colletotrichum karsti]|uniref:Nephrocystin 3-like N-terminal domain-containing protein n=1 Tax=Colletotrichum karsti TaxID=1095194 RepID=A0A9P6I4K0_9PEZI|nr:uncharacterized protein CkaCkLH20_06201 [Colletotrichum karsti]KAF9876258.1 hypothetical protein CkaCkLH20_06201 [Colletotrichum karsti]
MSGLEAIAALGLACNILQLIGTVGSTITVARNILETGEIDPDLEKHTNELTSLFQDAEGSLSQTSQHKGDKELRAAAGQVLKATREFGSELVKISGGASKGKIRQVIGGTVKGLWRRKKLDELEAEISRCRGMFESRLLLSLRHRIDLGALQQKESFGQLDNSLKSFIKGLSDGHTKLEELMKYQSTTLIDHVTEESRQTRQEISAAIEPVVQKMNHEEKQRFLGSLRYDTMNERRNRVEAAHPGTYKWIFYDSEAPNVDDGDDGDEDGDCDTRYVPKDGIPDFIKSASEKIYWISGKPGSGKSTLMKFMLENSRMADLLNKTSPTGASKIASHFIWAAGAPIQRSLRGTLSSLLFQLVTQDEGALDNLLSKCPNNPQRLSLGDWSDQQLAEALKIVCSSSRSVICLFIDGLDEIDSDDTDKVLAIIDDLCTLTHVKCIVSSRPEQIFSRHFRKLETPSLRMQDLTARDIRLYVRGKLRSWSHSPDRYHDVVKTLCEKADGVFLWVALALKSQRLSAEYEDDPEIVARRFKQLPNGLSELYSDMWDRLNDDKFIYGEEGAKYLNTYLTATHGVLDMDVSTMAFATHPALIMGSSKPPTPPILEHMERTLEKTAVWLEVRTAGLIEVNPKSETVELDASPEHCILFQVSWNRRPNHLFEHNLEFNVFIELPLKMLWEAYNWIKDELSTSFLDVVGSREDLMSAMPELKPRLIFIQCWDPPSKSLEFLDLYPEKYFSLKTEEDKRFVTTAVMQELVMAQEVQTWQEESSALPAFCNSRIADNCFETISTSQFEDILIERGHAFRPSQENPWPPAMFEGMAGPGVGENSGTEDYPSTPATKNGYNAQVYTWNMGGEEFKGVIEGDGLRVVR